MNSRVFVDFKILGGELLCNLLPEPMNVDTALKRVYYITNVSKMIR